MTRYGFNVRTRVHEYGGGAYWVHGGSVFFANWDDQRLYRQDPDAAPAPITPRIAASGRASRAVASPDPAPVRSAVR